ncbi:MAG: hypothetical protein WBB22_17400 [Anaerolineae bacterium]
MSILAMHSSTDWIRVLSGMAPMDIVFTITTFVAAIFPFMKREPMKLGLILFIR